MSGIRRMRRAKTEITDAGEIEEIIGSASCLFLGVKDDPAPYLVPLFYGYASGRLYIHCARAGTKLDLIAKDPNVGFAIAENPVIVAGEAACSSSTKARSVVGDGTARVVTDPEERLLGLGAIMSHYGSDNRTFKPESLERTCVLAVDIRRLRARRIS